MKHLLTTALILALAAPVHAGGPVITEDAYEAEPAPKHDRKALPYIIGAIVIAAILAGQSDTCNQPEPETPVGGGC